jgi:hypothetical protein
MITRARMRELRLAQPVSGTGDVGTGLSQVRTSGGISELPELSFGSTNAAAQ